MSISKLLSKNRLGPLLLKRNPTSVDFNKLVEEVNTAFEDISGGAQIKTLKRHITSSEILNCGFPAYGGSPVELLPPPGIGKFYIMLGGQRRYNYGTTEYQGNTVIRIFSEIVLAPDDANGIFNTFNINQIPPFGDYQSSTISCYLEQVSGNISKNILKENTGVYLGVNDVSPTNGDGTLDIYLQYMELDA